MASCKLTRSETDRVIAGVAGGIAAHFDIDPTLVRIGFAVAGFMGWGILAYLILWVAVPSGTPANPAVRIAEERFAHGAISAEELARIRQDLERTS